MTPSAPAGPGYRRSFECLLGLPATDGNRVDVLQNGDRSLAAMLEAIDAATRTVDLQTFGHWSGSTGEEFTQALAGRARAGVRVRLLLDALGSRRMDKQLLQRLAEAGAEVQWFRPLTNWRVTQSTHRGHRKILICDGEVAFTGGIGIADRWRGDAARPSEWRDTVARVRGPAVNGLRGAFVDNWAEVRRPFFDEAVDPFPVQPEAGSTPVQVVRSAAETGWGDMSSLARSLIELATRRLRIGAGYFVPDNAAFQLMSAATTRGVSIELLRSAPTCDRSASQVASQAQYGRLLEAGVKVWEYQPTMFNAKVITLDGQVAVIGPVNFDSRSLTYDEEVMVVVFDPEVVGALDAQFDADLGRAEEVRSASWEERDRRRRAVEGVVGYLARRV